MKSQNQLERKTEIVNDVKKSIVLAFERTNSEPFDIDGMCEDVVGFFPELGEKDFAEAIKRGALGYYGKTYKMSAQEVCIWIKKYKDEKSDDEPKFVA